jgi:hypothetical protein
MKKLIFLLCFLAVSAVASAQIQYVPTYNRNQGRTAPQSSSQTYRTTAYAMDSNGNVYKMPIMVQVTSNGYGNTTVKVTQKYVSTGLGGQWENVYDAGAIQKCMPIASQHPLESEFMYKATIGVTTWYFDL